MKNINILLLLIMLSLSITGLAQQKTIGDLVIADSAFTDLIEPSAKIELLAEGFKWSEGPVWNKEGKFLLFSDVPENTIYKWKEREGLSVFLKPSGFTGILPYGDEPGSNGLIFNNNGELVACEHGDRRVSRMGLKGEGKYPIADNWQGKRFNSPNDVVQATDGTYYFTDPPYGMPAKEKSKTREIEEFGVYKVSPKGDVEMVISNLNRPNGVALSPDEKLLYVAQSDPERAIIMVYKIKADGTLNAGEVFFDATEMVKAGLQGLPDGLKTDKKGNIFTTGPGGVLVLNSKGKLLGRIATGVPTANCNWGDDGSILYITANNYLCRIKTKTIGKGF